MYDPTQLIDMTLKMIEEANEILREINSHPEVRDLVGRELLTNFAFTTYLLGVNLKNDFGTIEGTQAFEAALDQYTEAHQLFTVRLQQIADGATV